jgi:hypothetical protein
MLLHQLNVVFMQFYAASSLGWHAFGPLPPTNSATVAVNRSSSTLTENMQIHPTPAVRRCVAPGSSESVANKGGTSSLTTSIADDIA